MIQAPLLERWTITAEEKFFRVYNKEYNKVCFVENFEDAMFFIERIEEHRRLICICVDFLDKLANNKKEIP